MNNRNRCNPINFRKSLCHRLHHDIVILVVGAYLKETDNLCDIGTGHDKDSDGPIHEVNHRYHLLDGFGWQMRK